MIADRGAFAETLPICEAAMTPAAAPAAAPATAPGPRRCDSPLVRIARRPAETGDEDPSPFSVMPGVL